MSSGMIIGLEMVLVLGVVLGLAVWELVRLRRDRVENRKAAPPPPRAAVDETSRAAEDTPLSPP